MQELIFLIENNLVFSNALGIVFIIGILEFVSILFLGLGILSLGLDHCHIHTDMPDGNVDFFGWLNQGRVPVLFIFIIMLTAFGLLGLGTQLITYKLFNFFVPNLVAVPIIFIITLPVVRRFSLFYSRYMPKEESTAVSRTTFIGLEAVITLGIATENKCAEAKVKDFYGETHYIMVKPDNSEESLQKGDKLIISSKDLKNESIFIVKKIKE